MTNGALTPLLAPDELENHARLCSQTVLEIAAELDGDASASWSLTRRVRNAVGRTYLRDYFGNVVAAYDEVPALDELRPRIDQWLSEVKARRRAMGKA